MIEYRKKAFDSAERLWIVEYRIHGGLWLPVGLFEGKENAEKCFKQTGYMFTPPSKEFGKSKCFFLYNELINKIKVMLRKDKYQGDIKPWCDPNQMRLIE